MANLTGVISRCGTMSGSVSNTKTVDSGLSTGSSGTKDYNKLTNKPSIEGHELIGDKTFKQLGLDTLTVQDIDEIIYGG